VNVLICVQRLVERARAVVDSFVQDNPVLVSGDDTDPDDNLCALEENLTETYGAEVASLVIGEVIGERGPDPAPQAVVTEADCALRASIRVRFKSWHTTLLLHPSESKPITPRHAVDRLHSV
jgi:hypothetical protein